MSAVPPKVKVSLFARRIGATRDRTRGVRVAIPLADHNIAARAESFVQAAYSAYASLVRRKHG